jgi:ATP-dependent DNA helicase RecQ
MMKKEFGNFLPSKTGKNEKRAEERLIKSLIKEQTKNLTVTNPSLNITKEVNGLEDKALFEKLKEWRKNKAKEENTLPYVVFHDTTLHEISKIKPKNEDELLKIKGIGEIKINKYGKDILSIVRG